jgi:hypothetical protein
VHPSCYRLRSYKTIVWLLTFLGVYPLPSVFMALRSAFTMAPLFAGGKRAKGLGDVGDTMADWALLISHCRGVVPSMKARPRFAWAAALQGQAITPRSPTP